MSQDLLQLLTDSVEGGGLIGLLTVARERELRSLADIVLLSGDATLTANRRFLVAKDRPGLWPDLLAEALDRLAGGDLLAACCAGDTGAVAEPCLVIAMIQRGARLRLGAHTATPRRAILSVRALAVNLSNWLAAARDGLLSSADLLSGLPGAERLGATRMPPCNVMLVGRVGSGKGTLINAVFGEQLSPTGIEQPVTRHATWHEIPGNPMRLLNTRGLEAGNYQEAMRDLQQAIGKQRGQADATRQPHVAWLCIDSSGARIEESDRALARSLNDWNVPVIVVLTKTWRDSKLAEEAARFFPGAQIIPVLAARRKFDNGQSVAAFGLGELIEATADRLPQGRKAAFAAAQVIALQPKIDSARQAIAYAVNAAAVAAAVPIPFSDAIVIGGIQGVMIVEISRRMGITLEETKINALVAALAGPVLASFAGRTAVVAVGNLAKMVPGVGSVVGGTLNARVATLLTRGLGNSYLDWLVEQRKLGGTPGVADIVEYFKRQAGL